MFIVLFSLVAFACVLCAVFAFSRNTGYEAGPRWLVASGCCGLAALVLVASAFHTGTSGGGDSIGTIVNVAHEGYWWKPAKVYFLHRGEVKSDEFGIEPALVEAAQRAADDGALVRVTYDSSIICGAWNYADCDVIQKITTDVPQIPKGATP